MGQIFYTALKAEEAKYIVKTILKLFFPTYKLYSNSIGFMSGVEDAHYSFRGYGENHMSSIRAEYYPFNGKVMIYTKEKITTFSITEKPNPKYE